MNSSFGEQGCFWLYSISQPTVASEGTWAIFYKKPMRPPYRVDISFEKIRETTAVVKYGSFLLLLHEEQLPVEPISSIRGKKSAKSFAGPLAMKLDHDRQFGKGLPSSMYNIFGSVPSERPPLLTDLLALYGWGSLEPIHWLSDRLQGNLWFSL
jgi:hypothetical protein